MKLINPSVLAILVLQASCSSDGGSGEGHGSEALTGDRRLSQIRVTFGSGRVDTLTYTYDENGIRESELLESDALPSLKTSFIQGEDGLVIRAEQDEGVDGSIETTIRYQYENGRLVTRDYDYDQDFVADTRRLTTFDSQGRFAGYLQYVLSDSGEQLSNTANVVVTYPSSDMVVSERDLEPLGTTDLRVEYMTLPSGEVTSSVESYFQDDESTSVSEWSYEDEACDMRWQGLVYADGGVKSEAD